MTLKPSVTNAQLLVPILRRPNITLKPTANGLPPRNISLKLPTKGLQLRNICLKPAANALQLRNICLKPPAKGLQLRNIGPKSASNSLKFLKKPEQNRKMPSQRPQNTSLAHGK